MTIEIKGLAAGVTAARKGISDARAKVAAMQEAGSSLAATVDDVTTALKQAEADIRFEAAQLGNGGPPSTSSGEQSKAATVTTAAAVDAKPADQPKPTLVPAALAPSNPQVSSFRPSAATTLPAA